MFSFFGALPNGLTKEKKVKLETFGLKFSLWQTAVTADFKTLFQYLLVL